ncbi:GNAT family N-acetyltransferase [Nocardiopsis lucentensis]|uniref:GNAT family N-acetyltransferase n=1 Tax=Nocardiopsis lucentensis TaxID=53441 RepID=UPI00036BD477|nr:GNAT family N-acetyltransferase [Nocardiopsis lucentensis]
MTAVSDLRVTAYLADGLLEASPAYAETLRLLGADGTGEVLVAVDGERLLGTIMYEPWSPDSEVARSADEAEIRAFAVAPQARGLGVGRALVNALVERARQEGVVRIVLSLPPLPQMRAAQFVYRARGFTRVPERDWTPVPGVDLQVYALALKS